MAMTNVHLAPNQEPRQLSRPQQLDHVQSPQELICNLSPFAASRHSPASFTEHCLGHKRQWQYLSPQLPSY